MSIGNSDVNIGANFKGYLRNFKVFRKMYTNPEIYKTAAFSYLHPDGNPDLLLSLGLQDAKNTSGLFEQVNQAVFKGQVTSEKDYSPNWDCFWQEPDDFG